MRPAAINIAEHPVVLFDGLCNFCDRQVNRIIDHDPHGHFRFAAKQSDAGRRLLANAGLNQGIESIVLLEAGRAYLHSEAALRIARRLSFPLCLASAGVTIPRFLRDAIYRAFAARRYRWFGQRDACRMPTPDRAARFLI